MRQLPSVGWHPLGVADASRLGDKTRRMAARPLVPAGDPDGDHRHTLAVRSFICRPRADFSSARAGFEALQPERAATAHHAAAVFYLQLRTETGSRLRMPSRPALRIINPRGSREVGGGTNVGTVHGHDARRFRGLSRRPAAGLAALVSASRRARRAETPRRATQLAVPDAVADNRA